MQVERDRDNEEKEWSHHGLPVAAGKSFELDILEEGRRCKVCDFKFIDSNYLQVSDPDYFWDLTPLRRGGVYDKAEIFRELEKAALSGMFSKLFVRGRANKDGSITLLVHFVERTWKPVSSFSCVSVAGAQCMLSPDVQTEVSTMLKQGMTPQSLKNAKDRICKWYEDQGYEAARVVSWTGLGTSNILCTISEGHISKVKIAVQDNSGKPVYDMEILKSIEGLLPDQLLQGSVYTVDAARQFLSNVGPSNQMFSDVIVDPCHDDMSDGIIVEIQATLV
jgi:hypothetical protein